LIRIAIETEAEGLIATTVAFETFWRFAAERMAMFYRRMTDSCGPWTQGPILRAYRFTNVYRATDRVSQYLIREVQYRGDRSQEPSEVFFRTLLFKIFNKIETWDALEAAHGTITWRSVDLESIDQSLTRIWERGDRIYSAAYIMANPPFGHERKHSNHLALLHRMMEDRLPDRLRQAPDLQTVYERLLSYPGLGRFLAFQYTIDLNYSSLLDFDEADFVVAGPGALDGISKCFVSPSMNPEEIIRWVTERQELEFSSRGLAFEGLFGRLLQPIDCQNLFCEISKYTRVAHPEIVGVAQRTRIKQGYKKDSRKLGPLAFPPKWGIKPSTPISLRPVAGTMDRQFALV
jgi:hypothetical protein